jgi:hypothetical protein
MYFNGQQIKALVEALSRAFNPGRFDQLLLGRLNKVRVNITLKGDYIGILYDVVETANAEGWTLDLLSAARASNPRNPHLVEFEESLELGVTPIADKAAFEKIVNERSIFADVAAFRGRLGSLETWVCAFEIPGSGGTGFLIKPDIVLTNYHVIESMKDGSVSPADVRCRFDYKMLPGGGVVSGGTAVGLAADWDVGHAQYSQADTQADNNNWGKDELDFALVRLERAIGSESIGENAEPEAPDRGWQKLSPNPPALVADDVVFVLQHPQDLNAATTKLQPMQLSSGTIIGFAGNGLRVRHNSRTLPGSSGSPIFNANLEFAALHHAGEPNNRLDYKGSYNQAIPLTEITRYLTDNGQNGILAD